MKSLIQCTWNLFILNNDKTIYSNLIRYNYIIIISIFYIHSIIYRLKTKKLQNQLAPNSAYSLRLEVIVFQSIYAICIMVAKNLLYPGFKIIENVCFIHCVAIGYINKRFTPVYTRGLFFCPISFKHSSIFWNVIWGIWNRVF